MRRVTPLAMPEIIMRLALHSPRREPAPDSDPASQAAVALILHAPGHGRSPELLFIERAHHPADPWSGQMGFPGGRMEEGDPHLGVTAARETLEEVGVALGDPIGQLDDTTNARMREHAPQVRPIAVTPFVYVLEQRPRVTRNHEVASTVWIPFEHILDPRSASAYRMEAARLRASFPAFVYDRYRVWGMTYRIIESFAALFDLALPASVRHPEAMRTGNG